MRRRRTGIVALVLVVAVLAVAAFATSASAQTGGSKGCGDGGDWCGGGIWNGAGAWGGTGMWGAGCGAQWLLDNPTALEAWLQMRADHQQAMQDWYDTYEVGGLTTPEAQQALRDLWTTFWNDMQDFYELYGNGAAWVCPGSGCWAGGMWGAKYGGDWLLQHPSAFADYLDLRAGQVDHVTAWSRLYSTSLTGRAARSAARNLEKAHRAEIVGFFKDHSITSGASWGYGGWMGLGGIWGGFGW